MQLWRCTRLRLCGNLQFATFLFFASCVALMTIAIAWLLPETKGVPIEEVDLLWERHFVWRHVVKPKKQDEHACAVQHGSASHFKQQDERA